MTFLPGLPPCTVPCRIVWPCRANRTVNGHHCCPSMSPSSSRRQAAHEQVVNARLRPTALVPRRRDRHGQGASQYLRLTVIVVILLLTLQIRLPVAMGA